MNVDHHLLVSRGTVYFAMIATLNLLLIMAAIANDDAVGVSTSSTNISVTSTTSLPLTTPPSTIQTTLLTRRSTTLLPPAARAIIDIPSSTRLISSSTTTTTTTSPTPTTTFSTTSATTSTTTPPPLPTALPLIANSQGHQEAALKDPTVKVLPLSPTGKPPIPISIGETNSTLSPPLDLFNSSSSSTSPFTTLNYTAIRAQSMSNALLPCNVRNSGDGVTVSWIRRKDYHLLTVGLQTYASDDRFQAIHAQSPEDWTLKIKYVQPRDEGIYECQVSTHPPSSIFVALNVVEVQAEIVGGPEKIVKAGSTVELKCDLSDSTQEPEYVFWYQGLQMINYDRSRHINVTHYKSSSVLVLHNAQKSDSGNYSCVPSNAQPASIIVHIIHNGENPAAMQHGSHSTSCVPCPPLWFLAFFISLSIQIFYFYFMSCHVDTQYHYFGSEDPKTSSSSYVTSKPGTHLYDQHHHNQPRVSTRVESNSTQIQGYNDTEIIPENHKGNLVSVVRPTHQHCQTEEASTEESDSSAESCGTLIRRVHLFRPIGEPSTRSKESSGVEGNVRSSTTITTSSSYYHHQKPSQPSGYSFHSGNCTVR